MIMKKLISIVLIIAFLSNTLCYSDITNYTNKHTLAKELSLSTFDGLDNLNAQMVCSAIENALTKDKSLDSIRKYVFENQQKGLLSNFKLIEHEKELHLFVDNSILIRYYYSDNRNLSFLFSGSNSNRELLETKSLDNGFCREIFRTEHYVPLTIEQIFEHILLKAELTDDIKLTVESFDTNPEQFAVCELSEEEKLLRIHPNFKQDFNDIKDTNIGFSHTLENGVIRWVDLADSIAYRAAMHEFNLSGRKGLAHAKKEKDGRVSYSDSELLANFVGRNYSLVDDAMWLWYLHSYSMSDIGCVSDDKFEEQLRLWLFIKQEHLDKMKDSQDKRDRIDARDEFPALLEDDQAKEQAISLALQINKEFRRRYNPNKSNKNLQSELKNKPSMTDQAIRATGGHSYRRKPERELNEKIAEMRASLDQQRDINRAIEDLEFIMADYKNANSAEQKDDLTKRFKPLLHFLAEIYHSISSDLEENKDFTFYQKLLQEKNKEQDELYKKIIDADKNKQKKTLQRLNIEAVSLNKLIIKLQIRVAGMILRGRSEHTNVLVGCKASYKTLIGAVNNVHLLREELRYRISRLHGGKLMREFDTTDWMGDLIKTSDFEGFDMEILDSDKEEEYKIFIRQGRWINVHTTLRNIQAAIKKGDNKFAFDKLKTLTNIYSVRYIIANERYHDIADELKAMTKMLINIADAHAPPSDDQMKFFNDKVNALIYKIAYPNQKVWVDVPYKSLDKALRGRTIHPIKETYEPEYALCLGFKQNAEHYARLLEKSAAKKNISARDNRIIVLGLDRIMDDWARGKLTRNGKSLKRVDEKTDSQSEITSALHLLKSKDFTATLRHVNNLVKNIDERMKNCVRITRNLKKHGARIYREYCDQDIQDKISIVEKLIQKKEYNDALLYISALNKRYFEDEHPEPGYQRASKTIKKAENLLRKFYDLNDNTKISGIIPKVNHYLNQIKSDIENKSLLRITVNMANQKPMTYFVDPSRKIVPFVSWLKSQGIWSHTIPVTEISRGRGWKKAIDLTTFKLEDEMIIHLRPKQFNRIGKRAQPADIIDVDQAKYFDIVDTNGQILVESVEAIPREDINVVEILRQNIKEYPDYKEVFESFISLFEHSPPPIVHVFDKTAGDMFGFYDADENIIAIHQSILNNPVAIFHEIGEYLAVKELIVLSLEGNQIKFLTEESGVVSPLTISDEVMRNFEYEYWWNRASKSISNFINEEDKTHYYWRILSQEIFRNKDYLLTRDIQLQRICELSVNEGNKPVIDKIISLFKDEEFSVYYEALTKDRFGLRFPKEKVQSVIDNPILLLRHLSGVLIEQEKITIDLKEGENDTKTLELSIDGHIFSLTNIPLEFFKDEQWWDSKNKTIKDQGYTRKPGFYFMKIVFKSIFTDSDHKDILLKALEVGEKGPSNREVFIYDKATITDLTDEDNPKDRQYKINQNGTDGMLVHLVSEAYLKAIDEGILVLAVNPSGEINAGGEFLFKNRHKLAGQILLVEIKNGSAERMFYKEEGTGSKLEFLRYSRHFDIYENAQMLSENDAYELCTSETEVQRGGLVLKEQLDALWTQKEKEAWDGNIIIGAKLTLMGTLSIASSRVFNREDELAKQRVLIEIYDRDPNNENVYIARVYYRGNSENKDVQDINESWYEYKDNVIINTVEDLDSTERVTRKGNTPVIKDSFDEFRPRNDEESAGSSSDNESLGKEVTTLKGRVFEELIWKLLDSVYGGSEKVIFEKFHEISPFTTEVRYPDYLVNNVMLADAKWGRAKENIIESILKYLRLKRMNGVKEPLRIIICKHDPEIIDDIYVKLTDMGIHRSRYEILTYKKLIKELREIVQIKIENIDDKLIEEEAEKIKDFDENKKRISEDQKLQLARDNLERSILEPFETAVYEVKNKLQWLDQKLKESIIYKGKKNNPVRDEIANLRNSLSEYRNAIEKARGISEGKRDKGSIKLEEDAVWRRYLDEKFINKIDKNSKRSYLIKELQRLNRVKESFWANKHFQKRDFRRLKGFISYVCFKLEIDPLEEISPDNFEDIKTIHALIKELNEKLKMFTYNVKDQWKKIIKSDFLLEQHKTTEENEKDKDEELIKTEKVVTEDVEKKPMLLEKTSSEVKDEKLRAKKLQPYPVVFPEDKKDLQEYVKASKGKVEELIGFDEKTGLFDEPDNGYVRPISDEVLQKVWNALDNKGLGSLLSSANFVCRRVKSKSSDNKSVVNPINFLLNFNDIDDDSLSKNVIAELVLYDFKEEDYKYYMKNLENGGFKRLKGSTPVIFKGDNWQEKAISYMVIAKIGMLFEGVIKNREEIMEKEAISIKSKIVLRIKKHLESSTNDWAYNMRNLVKSENYISFYFFNYFSGYIDEDLNRDNDELYVEDKKLFAEIFQYLKKISHPEKGLTIPKEIFVKEEFSHWKQNEIMKSFSNINSFESRKILKDELIKINARFRTKRNRNPIINIILEAKSAKDFSGLGRYLDKGEFVFLIAALLTRKEIDFDPSLYIDQSNEDNTNKDLAIEPAPVAFKEVNNETVIWDKFEKDGVSVFEEPIPFDETTGEYKEAKENKIRPITNKMLQDAVKELVTKGMGPLLTSKDIGYVREQKRPTFEYTEAIFPALLDPMLGTIVKGNVKNHISKLILYDFESKELLDFFSKDYYLGSIFSAQINIPLPEGYDKEEFYKKWQIMAFISRYFARNFIERAETLDTEAVRLEDKISVSLIEHLKESEQDWKNTFTRLSEEGSLIYQFFMQYFPAYINQEYNPIGSSLSADDVELFDEIFNYFKDNIHPEYGFAYSANVPHRELDNHWFLEILADFFSDLSKEYNEYFLSKCLIKYDPKFEKGSLRAKTIKKLLKIKSVGDIISFSDPELSFRDVVHLGLYLSAEGHLKYGKTYSFDNGQMNLQKIEVDKRKESVRKPSKLKKPSKKQQRKFKKKLKKKFRATGNSTYKSVGPVSNDYNETGEILKIAVSDFVNSSESVFSQIYNENMQPLLYRISIEMLELIGLENAKTFIKTIQPQGFKNISIELYSLKDKSIIDADSYHKYGIKQNKFSDVCSRTNTLTFFQTSQSDQIKPGIDIIERIGGIAPDNTILMPVGVNDSEKDLSGLVRSFTLGLSLLKIARDNQKGRVDNAFVKSTLDDFKELCESTITIKFDLTEEDLLAIAIGNVNKVIHAVQKLINLLPITPINTEELRELFSHTLKVVTAA